MYVIYFFLISILFSDYFEVVNEFQVSEEVMIGGLFQLNVYDNNTLSIVDLTNRKNEVIIVNSKDGSIKSVVNVEQCFPGYNARYLGINSANDTIYYLSYGFPAIIKFDADGVCKGIIDSEELSFALSFAVLNNDIVASLGGPNIAQNNSYHIARFDNEGTRIETMFTNTDSERLFINSRRYDNITQGHNAIYHTQALWPVINVFNSGGMEKITIEADFFSEFDEEFEMSGIKTIRDLQRYEREFFENKYLFEGVLVLDKYLLAQFTRQHSTNREKILILLDEFGNKMHDDYINIDDLQGQYITFGYFAGSYGDKLYSIHAPDEQSDNLNPIIKVYRLKTEALQYE